MVKYTYIYIQFRKYSFGHISAAWCVRFAKAYRLIQTKIHMQDIWVFSVSLHAWFCTFVL